MPWDQAGGGGVATAGTTGTAGAPTAGAWSTGQIALDSNGYAWICTAGGSPGTWAAIPAGKIGYTQITANVTGITTQADLGVASTVTVGSGRRIRVSAFCAGVTGTLAAAFLYIMEGATQLVVADLPTLAAATAAYNSKADASVILTPSAGAHTYKLQGKNDGTANAAVFNAAATYPTYILVEDIGT